MFHLPRKFIIVVSIFVFFFFTFLVKVPPIFAQNPQDVFYPSVDSYTKEIKDAREQAKKDNSVVVTGQFVNNYELNSTLFNLSSMITCLHPDICDDRRTALGVIARVMDSMYANPPASISMYALDVLTNTGVIAKSAHAQGIGFAGFLPLLSLWKTTRNIAYIVMVVILIAIGFMIIFRTKIDPKTVISIQAALPKIILTMILITFSYPIMGFLVDLMYVVTAILIQILAIGFNQPSRATEFQTWYMNGGIGQLAWSIFSGGSSAIDDFLAKWSWPVGAGTSGAGGIIIGLLTRSLLNLIPGVAAVPALIVFILLLGMLFTFCRILILLLNSYIQLLLALIIGPLQLLTEAIPGRSAFSAWILNIIANLVVFPTTIALLMFAEFLTQYNQSTSLWQPPLMGVPMKESFFAFLGVGVIFLMPTLVAQVKKIFHPQPVMPLSTGSLFAPVTGATQTTMGAASQIYYLQTMPGISRLFGKGGGHSGPPA